MHAVLSWSRRQSCATARRVWGAGGTVATALLGLGFVALFVAFLEYITGVYPVCLGVGCLRTCSKGDR